MGATEDLLRSMPGEVGEDGTVYLTIDPDTRVITVPSNEKTFGVETDKDSERKYFRCPRIVGDNIDLSQHKIYISYVSTTSKMLKIFPKADGSYWCDDVAVDGDYITFSWKLSGNVFKEPGFVAFKVLAKKTDGDVLKIRWNTAPAFGTVLLTVPDGESVEERYPDIVTQLLERMDAVEAIATEEAMQGYVNEYLGEHPVQLDKTLTDNTKAAPAGVVGELKSDIEYFKDDVAKAFNVTENLYNPHSFTNTKGIALTIADGTEYADSTTVNAITTGYFDTNDGDVWRFYRWNTAKDNIFGMEIRVHWFNENEEYISGAIITGEATAPTNARYLRFTEKFTLLYPTLDVMVTKNYSFGVNGYVPYGITQLKETFLPKEKVYEQLQKIGTLHSGESWVLENNNIMARKVFVLSGIVSSFSTLEMGHGTKTNSPSSWVVVDNENITVYSTPTNKVTLAHGLTIKNTIQIIIEVGANYKAKITLLSNGEKYNTEQDWDGNIGNIFVNSVNTELVNCAVSWTCKNYSSKIWAYGDSYFGMTNKARWIAQLLSNGYGTDMLIDGYPGRGSDDAYNSLQASLKHGKPKYILWAMGMNNPDNESSVNENWNNRFNDVKNLCKENDITLIGCTIPNTPTQFNSYKNNVVRNAGIRYIDFAKSVGGEHIGDSWYEGMLSSDNVHPTEKGAITLYLQALADFPELANT